MCTLNVYLKKVIKYISKNSNTLITSLDNPESALKTYEIILRIEYLQETLDRIKVIKELLPDLKIRYRILKFNFTEYKLKIELSLNIAHLKKEDLILLVKLYGF